MSFRYYISLQAEFGSSTPPEFIDWIRAAVAGDPAEPTYELEEQTASVVEDVARLLALPGAATLTDVDRWGWRLEVQAKVHESDGMAVYGLPAVVAPFCDDGMIGAAWTDMNDVDPNLFLVQRGVLFIANRNGLPVPMVDSEAPAPIWRLDIERKSDEEIGRLAPSHSAELIHAEHELGDAALARFLFVRTVERRLRAFDPVRDLSSGVGAGAGDQSLAKNAARWGAEVVLETLDLGGDPLVVKDTPGWLLQEVEARRRYSSSTRQLRTSGRPLTGLSAAFDALSDPDIDAGPRPLSTGEIVETVVPLAMVARGPFIWSEDAAGRRSGSDHQLDVLVPDGNRLEVVTVYDKGHASCRPLDKGGDFAPWIQPPRHPSIQPQEPVAPMSEYELWSLRPEQEGSTFVRVAPFGET